MGIMVISPNKQMRRMRLSHLGGIRYTVVAALDGCPDLFDAGVLNYSRLCSLPTKPSSVSTQAEGNQKREAPKERRSKGGRPLPASGPLGRESDDCQPCPALAWNIVHTHLAASKTGKKEEHPYLVWL